MRGDLSTLCTRRNIAIACIGVLLVTGGTLFYMQVSTLRKCRSFIEFRFADQLLLIKEKSLSLDEMKAKLGKANDADFETAAYGRKIEDEIKAAFALVPAIYGATWASDEHPHGVGVLKDRPQGVTIRVYPLLCSMDDDGLNAVYVGETSSHEKLIVFEGRIPNGAKKIYWIYFRYNDVVSDVRSQ